MNKDLDQDIRDMMRTRDSHMQYAEQEIKWAREAQEKIYSWLKEAKEV